MEGGRAKRGNKDAWYNPATKESLHPDLNYPDPIGPHWDYIDPMKQRFRILPNGNISPVS